MRIINPNKLMKTNNSLSVYDKIDIYGDFPLMSYDYTIDMDDSKELDKYIRIVESNVRKSLSYREMLGFLKEYCGMTHCAFFHGISSEKDPDDPYSKKPRIEIHHEPFSLYDISLIVTRKRLSKRQSIHPLMVAKEVMFLHAKGLIGLIPLSLTIHKLVHASELFIGMDYVAGRHDIFFDLYREFMPSDLIDLYIENQARSNTISKTVLSDIEILQPKYLEIKNRDNMLSTDHEIFR